MQEALLIMKNIREVITHGKMDIKKGHVWLEGMGTECLFAAELILRTSEALSNGCRDKEGGIPVGGFWMDMGRKFYILS
jgi:hypothetical protein